jgi:hypothetical protein
MIIKSLSRKKNSFKRLFNYINKGAEKDSVFIHNLQPNIDTVHQFLKNSEYVPERKNGVRVYHEILSFHEDDKSISNEVLLDLANDWVELRASNNLTYGAIHREKNHVHIHLMISSNGLYEEKNLRLSKKEFKEIKLELEERQIKKYPQLQKSICQRFKDRKTNRKFKDFKNQKGKDKVSKMEEVQNLINQAIKSQDFKKYLQSQNIEFYKRGKNNGVIWKGKKYRFATLGFSPQLNEEMELEKDRPLTAHEEDIKILQGLHERDKKRREIDREI